MRIAPFLPLALLASMVAGCTAIDVDRLDDRYEALVRAERTELDSPDKVAPALLDAGAGTTFIDLARRARALAGKAGQPATRIALWRIAALSGWQSHAPDGFDLAIASADDAQNACDEMKTQRQFAPARDCAIAEIVPMLLAADTSWRDVQAAKTGLNGTVEQGNRRLAVIRSARADFIDRLPAWHESIEPAVGDNLQLGEWYRRSRELYACGVYEFAGVPLTTPDAALNVQLLREADALVLATASGLGLADPADIDAVCA